MAKKIIDDLVDYMLSAREAALPSAVVQKGKNHLLDTLAAIVSGSQLTPGRLGLEYTRSEGGKAEALVMGSDLLTTATLAAFANGISAHADESDDSNDRLHPGGSVVPAAWAVAERENRSGRSLLTAVVLGYEISCRFHKALATKSTTFSGTFGAAVAAGSLLRFDALRNCYLFSYAAQQASGSNAWIADDEHIEKAFDYGGITGRNGVMAALLVHAGFTGNRDVFEGDRNFLQDYPPADPSQLTSDLGTRYEMTRGLIKKFPVGAPMQEAVEAMHRLIERHKIRAADVVKVLVRLPERAAQTVDNRHMPDVNVQYILAVTLLDGRLSFEAAHDYGRMQHPDVQAMKSRVHLEVDLEMDRVGPRYQALVEVNTAGGEPLREHIVNVRGRPENPMSPEEVEAKSRELMAPVLGDDRVHRLFDAIRNLEAVTDISSLRPLLMKI
ncbi:MAG: MmgE/PrpD family protein [Candidatus Binatia bacterium]